MKTLFPMLRPWIVLALASYAIVGGHAVLRSLYTSLLRPDLASPVALATILGSMTVQPSVGAFWLPFARLVLRAGGTLQSLRLCLWTAIVTVVLRTVVEAAAGAAWEGFPALTSAVAIVAAVVLLAGRSTRDRPAQRVAAAGVHDRRMAS